MDIFLARDDEIHGDGHKASQRRAACEVLPPMLPAHRVLADVGRSGPEVVPHEKLRSVGICYSNATPRQASVRWKPFAGKYQHLKPGSYKYIGSIPSSRSCKVGVTGWEPGMPGTSQGVDVDKSQSEIVVVDLGSDMCKVGLAGDRSPRTLFPPHVTLKSDLLAMTEALIASLPVPRALRLLILQFGPWVVVEAHVCTLSTQQRRSTAVKWKSGGYTPVLEYGIVVDWVGMEAIWHQIFYSELRVNPQDCPVLLTEKPLNPHSQRELMTMMLLQAFGALAVHFALEPMLCLVAAVGLHATGVVMTSGRVSVAAPFYLGYLIPHAIQRSDFGSGQLLSHFTLHSKLQSGNILTDSGDTRVGAKGKYLVNMRMEEVREIMNKVCEVAMDVDAVLSQSQRDRYVKNVTETGVSWKKASNACSQVECEAPDGSIVLVGDERFLCPELLFRPGRLGSEQPGVHQLLHTAISCCPASMQPSLYSSIIAAGGNMMIPGMRARLTSELKVLAPSDLKVEVVVPMRPHLLAWIGGAMFAKTQRFRKECISKRDYQQHGPVIVHNKAVLE